jgi:hypothetical protein
MAEKMQIKAVDMVRRIRDEQAAILAGKSKAEIMVFFKKAGEAARQKTRAGHQVQLPPRQGG